MVILLAQVVASMSELPHEGFFLFVMLVTHGSSLATSFLQRVLECFQGQHFSL